MKAVTFSKIALSSLIAVLSTVSFAHGECKEGVCANLMDGFYVGAHAGYDAYRNRVSVTGPFGSFSNSASLTGWMGGLFVGYGQYLCDQFYLGAEIFGNYNGSNENVATGADDDGDSFTRNVKVKGTWGLSVIPGMKLNQATLGYLRFGYEWTNFSASNTLVDGDTGATFSASRSQTQNGFEFGFGLETVLCANWSVRAQYDHVWYNSKTYTVDDTSVKTRPSNNQITLGFLYHFC